MLRGNLIFTISPELTLDLMYNGYKVITIGESIDTRIFAGNSLPANIFTPPYESISALINDAGYSAVSIYENYLRSKECDDYLTSIIASLFYGNNIVILYEHEMFELGYIDLLIRYIGYTFGITYGPNGEMYYNQGYNSPILSSMYMYDLIDINTFFRMYPSTDNIIGPVVSKLVVDMKLSFPGYDEATYSAYLTNYKNEIQKPIIPIKIGVPQ